jgi:hypothetical protein
MFKRVTSLLFCAVLAALFSSTQTRAQQPVDAGYRDFSFAAPSGPSTPTGEKPESKLWFNDGIWWGSLYNPTIKGYRIYRFDVTTQSWSDTGTLLDPRSASRADPLWDGQHLYVASHIFTTNAASTSGSSNWGRLYRYSYNSQTKAYTLDAGFPVNVTKGKEESLVLAKDSTGQLWVTYVESGKVMVNCSLGSDSVWGTPFVLPLNQTVVSVESDDISSVIAFQGNKVGVMWSNQLQRKTYFAVHLDANADNVWQVEETALPGPNQAPGPWSDDHINLKTDSTGRVFAATKTSFTASTDPLVMLLVRDAAGNWSNYVYGLEGTHLTRPIILLDEEHSRLYMFATAPETSGVIYYKSTDINNIQFATGLGTPFIKSATDTTINNSTSTKQNLSSATGLVVLATDQNTKFYLHNYLSLGGTANQAPTVNAGPDQTITLPAGATLSGSATDDGLPNPPGAVSTTWTQASGPGTTTFANPNAASTTATFSTSGTYVLRLTASDSALSTSDDVSVTVNPASPTNQAPVVNAGPDQTITLPASASLSGSVTDDGLPNPPAAVTASWTQVSGPGTATFVNPNAASTTVSFSASGTYVLRLTGNDSALSASDDISITVNPASSTNQAPVVNAGPDQTVTLPSGATLSGNVTDDGLPNPPGTVTVAWTQVSGPGTATFANANAASTSVTFSTSGTYVLRLTASDSALSSSDDVVITVNPATPPGQNNIQFIESGSDATGDLKFFTSMVGVVSSDLSNPHTGPRAIKADSSNPANFAFVRKDGVLSDAGRRISFYFQYASAPAATTNILRLLAGGTNVTGGGQGTISLTTANRLSLYGQIGTTTLAPNTWYRITLAYTISSTTVNEFRLYLNGTLQASRTNLTLAAAGTNNMQLGWVGSTAGTSKLCYLDDIYIDDGNNLSDTGDVRVTAKLPDGDTVSTFGTAVGANPAAGSRFTNENERPLNVANGWTSSAAGQSERYVLQSAAGGDVNVSSFVLLGYTGWIYAKRSTAGAENMVLNGATVSKSLTTSAAMYTQVASGTGYPSSVAGIGLDASASGVTLYENGVVIAYLFSQ